MHLFKTRTNVTDQMFTKTGTGLSSDGPGGQGGQGGPGCQCGPDVHKSWDGVVFRWPRLDLLTVLTLILIPLLNIFGLHSKYE